jgi:hypothetical protein
MQNDQISNLGGSTKTVLKSKISPVSGLVYLFILRMDCAKTSESQATTWTLWMLFAVRFSSAARQRDLFNSTATTLFAKAIVKRGKERGSG